MTSRPPREGAVTCPPQGQGLHLHGHPVVKVQMTLRAEPSGRSLAAHLLYRLPFGGTIPSERVAPSGCSRHASLAALAPRAAYARAVGLPRERSWSVNCTLTLLRC